MGRRMARPALLRHHSATPVSVTAKHRLMQGVRVRVISKDAVGTNAYDAFGVLGIRVKCHGIDLMDIQVRPLCGVQRFAKWHWGALNVIDPPRCSGLLLRGVHSLQFPCHLPFGVWFDWNRLWVSNNF